MENVKNLLIEDLVSRGWVLGEYNGKLWLFLDNGTGWVFGFDPDPKTNPGQVWADFEWSYLED